MDIKFVSYDGKYPNLCRGQLVVEIDGKLVKFGLPLFSDDLQFDYKPFWMSGGGVELDPETCDVNVTEGPWIKDYCISEKDFPKEIWDAIPQLIDIMNENVNCGCCGGCS